MASLDMVRGDTAQFKFIRLDIEGNPILTQADEVYFTVKGSASNTDAELQVRKDDMTFDSTTGQYTFVVKPEMTNGLSFKSKHYYDVEVIDNGVKTTIAFGEFILKPEITWAVNEEA